jgi:hypothetical protein
MGGRQGGDATVEAAKVNKRKVKKKRNKTK